MIVSFLPSWQTTQRCPRGKSRLPLFYSTDEQIKKVRLLTMNCDRQSVNNSSINNNFEFLTGLSVHVPRAWERAPQPSHLARHKGRKVWKRPEARAREDIEKHGTPAIEERNPLRDVSSNTPRPVKRLRVKDGLAKGERDEKGGFANYFATLRDGAIGTPKRELNCVSNLSRFESLNLM